MKLQQKFWLLSALLLASIFCAVGFLLYNFWGSLEPEVQENILTSLRSQAGIFALTFLFLAIVLLFILNEVFQYYIVPLDRLIEESQLISKLNPWHRIKVKGYREITQLAECFNVTAEKLQNLQEKVNSDEEGSDYLLQQQNQLLLNLINTLPLGIFVCNAQGQILMYNQIVKEYFRTEESDSTQICGLLGLEKSIFPLLHKFAASEDTKVRIKRMQEHIDSREELLLVAQKDHLLQGMFCPIQLSGEFPDFFLFFLCEEPLLQQLKSTKAWDMYQDKHSLSCACKFPLGDRIHKILQDNTPKQDARLDELAYTVFDTETTGLNPCAGDEIVSIAGVRILNCRLQEQEYFNKMVNPGRDIPREAERIHGISSAMVKQQPSIQEILPCFYNYAHNTVLVAHNADFDLLLLRLKEEETGVKFTNPVLDIMRLSAYVHKNQEDHSLEGIAHRLGVELKARHSALGDAWITAKIFLNLLPLLAEKEVYTLGQAIQADQSMSHIR